MILEVLNHIVLYFVIGCFDYVLVIYVERVLGFRADLF